MSTTVTWAALGSHSEDTQMGVIMSRTQLCQARVKHNAQVSTKTDTNPPVPATLGGVGRGAIGVWVVQRLACRPCVRVYVVEMLYARIGVVRFARVTADRSSVLCQVGK